MLLFLGITKYREKRRKDKEWDERRLLKTRFRISGMNDHFSFFIFTISIRVSLTLIMSNS